MAILSLGTFKLLISENTVRIGGFRHKTVKGVESYGSPAKADAVTFAWVSS